MTEVSAKIVRAAWKFVPAPVARRLRTEAGRRFTRFIPAAIGAVITSQVVLAILTGPPHVPAGTAGVIASLFGALVSYLLSRWAWERKGRPDLLRETLPFWAVSVAVWIVLGVVTHYASRYAASIGAHGLERHLIVNGAYLIANCVTFVTRFLIFHYILFRHRTPDEVPVEPGLAVQAAAVAAESEDQANSPSNGSSSQGSRLIGASETDGGRS
jgi:putative flippase GtrA